MENKKLKGKFLFGLIVGAIYLAVGTLVLINEIIMIFGFNDFFFFPADIMGGFTLIVIAVIFLFGAKELHAGINEGVAYIYVGILIAVILAVIAIILIGGELLNMAIESEWTFSSLDFTMALKPIVLLVLLPLFGLLVWRDKFALNNLAKAGK